MRQGHVIDESLRTNPNCDQRRTFAEAKQNLPEYDEQMVPFNEPSAYEEHAFLECDEDEQYDLPQYKNKYSASDSKVRYDEDDKPKPKTVGQTVRSADSFLNDHLPEYSHPEEGQRYCRKERPRRRKSRELAEGDVPHSSNDDEVRRKPEAMRSISEDMPPRTVKAITRRSLSHPEKDSKVLTINDFI